jgi:hypothetical protein
VKNRGEGKRMASSSDEWFLAIFPIENIIVLYNDENQSSQYLYK